MSKSYNPRRIRELDFKTDCDNVIFLSSSGHCSLDCSYCIISPVVKHQPTLVYEDFQYLLEQVKGRSLLILSGKGDFFAGYKKQEKLLARILDHDVEVALDINGVMLHEFAELPEEKLSRIRLVNLTMHYLQLIRSNALKAWKENALSLIEKKGGAHFLSGFILSPAERDCWRDALRFYDENIFASTRQPLVLIKDVNVQFDPATEELASTLERDFEHMVEEVYQEDFAARFAQFSHVMCPAGYQYFRVWNDGSVQGCPYISELEDCGNIKERRFLPRSNLFRCAEAKHCDCNNIALAGKMIFPVVVES
jgi:MoaA/NifB/PqqE/SkfB family radical SAM enzyme